MASAFDTGKFVARTPPAYTPGRIFYDADNECLSFYNNEAQISLQIGQETYVRAFNNTGSTIDNGKAVYVSGNSSGLPTIALARADAETTTNCVGLATQDIPNNTAGQVCALGLVRGLDTSSFADGAKLYLSASSAGTLTATVPSGQNFRVPVAVVTKVDASTGILFVLPAAIQNSPVIQYVVLDNDVTSTSISLANITGLSCSLVASATYHVEMYIIWQSAATTTGIGLAINGPASPTAVQGQVITTVSQTTRGFYNFRAYNDFAASGSIDAANTNTFAMLQAVVVNGSNAGSLIGRVASEVAGSQVTVKAGSFLKVTKVS